MGLEKDKVVEGMEYVATLPDGYDDRTKVISMHTKGYRSLIATHPSLPPLKLDLIERRWIKL